MNPTRVMMLTQAEYKALLRVTGEVNWRFRVALVIAHETGHRIGTIRQLRWSDIDWAGRRSEHEKTGYEHRTRVTVAVLELHANTTLGSATRHYFRHRRARPCV